MARSEGIVFETAFASYTSTRIVGQGGTARVYSAEDGGGQPWAVKVLDPQRASRDKLKRFKNEYAFCSSHSHRNIVSAVDHGVAVVDGAKSPFFVMPLFDGSLRTVMSRGLPGQRVLRFFSQVLDGLEAAHLHNVVHRDLKPENCLYNAKDETLVVADFGIAQFTAEELYTLVETGPGARLANFQYAAPEQRSRGTAVDRRADIYSLGLILNELFTGQLAHGTDYKMIAAVAPEYSYLDELVAEMLRQDPDRRPPTVENVKNQLIARGNDFIEKQQLDALKGDVVSSKEVSDPLISDPPRLVRAYWDDGQLRLTLSQPVTPKWIESFHNLGDFTAVLGKEPSRFQFSLVSGDWATIDARENEVQDIVDHFKNWLPRISSVYAANVREEARRSAEQERERLRGDIAAAELRQRINRSIRL